MGQQGASCYEKRGISCYTVTTCPFIILSSDFLQATNMRTYKRKTNSGTTPRETYMKAAKDVLAKTSSIRKVSAKYSINFMTLQRFCKNLEAASGGKCSIFKFLAFLFISQSQQNELCNASFPCGFKSLTLLLLSFTKLLFKKRQLTEGTAQRLLRCSSKRLYYISEPKQPSVPSIGYKRLRQVISDADESELEEYALVASKLYYGLTTKYVRNLA
jgi:hypothetical protein